LHVSHSLSAPGRLCVRCGALKKNGRPSEEEGGRSISSPEGDQGPSDQRALDTLMIDEGCRSGAIQFADIARATKQIELALFLEGKLKL
jgi:hypothetical protein